MFSSEGSRGVQPKQVKRRSLARIEKMGRGSHSPNDLRVRLLQTTRMGDCVAAVSLVDTNRFVRQASRDHASNLRTLKGRSRHSSSHRHQKWQQEGVLRRRLRHQAHMKTEQDDLLNVSLRAARILVAGLPRQPSGTVLVGERSKRLRR